MQINEDASRGPGTANGNRVENNSIFSNGGLGIDLGESTGVTKNDLGDADAGPNNHQNFPVITAAKFLTGMTTIAGTLNSTPNAGFFIQLYSNPSGNEGKTFLGQTSVTTNASGNASFSINRAFVVNLGKTTITALAVRAPTGDTSEFSAPRKVTAF